MGIGKYILSIDSKFSLHTFGAISFAHKFNNAENNGLINNINCSNYFYHVKENQR